MGHSWRQNVNAAALNLIVPGWGQFEQGRSRRGWLFLLATGLALLVLWITPLLGWPSFVGVLELIGVVAWSVADALFWRPSARARTA
jgi:hypothetical protein